MIIYVIGNSVAVGDGVPLELVWGLTQAFPSATIEQCDPSENFYPEEGSFLIDSVEGIEAVTVYSDVDAFATTHSVSVHDYDIGFHLQLLKKIHKLPDITIIGVPRFGNVDIVLSRMIELLKTL